MIDINQLRDLVNETLIEIELHSTESVELILGTIAQESHLGTYLRQLGNGPALGICQMEPATHDDIWNNYLKYKQSLTSKIIDIMSYRTTPDEHTSKELVWNLKYAIAMCRIHYLRKKGAIPKDLEGQAKYWKEHYNTYLGKGTTEEYINNYQRFVK